MRNGTPENIPLSDWQTIVQKLQRASPAPRTDLTGKADVRVSATCGNDQRRRLGGCGTCRRAASRAHQGTGRKQPRYFGTWSALEPNKGMKPGPSASWKLCVKRGRDGRDAPAPRVTV